MEEMVSCNLCGQNNFFVLAKKARGGLSARTCLCKNCGLIYINPRMSKNDYDCYYKGKIYPLQNLESNFENARKFGLALARRLADYWQEGVTIDIGSSTGGILDGLREALPGIKPLGIEPSTAEFNFANSKGIKTHHCLFENFSKEKTEEAANILCIQSLNHLLNPKSFLDWAFDNLKTGSHLFLIVKNFRHQCRRAASLEPAIQIDHPYMFTPETLKHFVESIGFKVVYLDVDEYKTKQELIEQGREGLPKSHIYLVAEKTENKQEINIPLSDKKTYYKLRWQLFFYH